MGVYEITAAEFNGSSDKTDDRVFWVQAETADVVRQALVGTGGTFHHEITAVGADVDFCLPADVEAMRAKLKSFEETRNLLAQRVKEAKQFGFRVHCGEDEDEEPHLLGRWWWSLSNDNWPGIDVSPKDYSSEQDAWEAAIDFLDTDPELSSQRKVSAFRTVDQKVLSQLKSLDAAQLSALVAEVVRRGYAGEDLSILVDVLNDRFGVSLSVFDDEDPDQATAQSVLFLEAEADAVLHPSACNQEQNMENQERKVGAMSSLEISVKVDYPAGADPRAILAHLLRSGISVAKDSFLAEQHRRDPSSITYEPETTCSDSSWQLLQQLVNSRVSLT